ncbi:Presenilins-associated rhomboid-like protein, mitochondrial [Trichinella zimbabwensis]|uniref:Presenilins-associated rhomboid-like protein, mitochondrial n=1 Tax=Trichinella zimbabwensis TaxID=268475 RepID=A0A0V1H6H5_9BILA|nr:Presenilins-associated rhomboid-like protein, mitochondrial [Trichinella zimbabwensis]
MLLQIPLTFSFTHFSNRIKNLMLRLCRLCYSLSTLSVPLERNIHRFRRFEKKIIPKKSTDISEKVLNGRNFRRNIEQFVIPVTERSLRYLCRPILFTAAFGCSCFLAATVAEYERYQSEKEYLLDRRNWRYEYGRKVGTLRQQLNDIWGNFTIGQKTIGGIIALNVAVYLAWKIPKLHPLLKRYFMCSYFGASLCTPMIYSVFSHINFLHMAVNMYVLWSFGPTLVRLTGLEQFAALYLTSGAVSSMCSLIIKAIKRDKKASVGASGAILAMLMYTCCKIPDAKLTIVFLPFLTFTASQAIIMVVGFDVAGLLFRWRLFDHAAHLGGSFFGILYAMYGEALWERRGVVTKIQPINDTLVMWARFVRNALLVLQAVLLRMSFFSCVVSCMPPFADEEVCFKKDLLIPPIFCPAKEMQTVRSVETPNETISDEEPLQSFDEWTKKKLEEQQNLKPKSVATPSGSTAAPYTNRNYASKDCGAKIMQANAGAQNVAALLKDKERDEYMLNACQTEVPKWFIVELCETVQISAVEIANFELFSSSPKEFRLWVSERYPTVEWNLVGEWTAQDAREVQRFQIPLKQYAKYIRVELLSHYGSEHFCPVSLFRVFGISMVEEYEAEAMHLEDESNVPASTSTAEGVDPSSPLVTAVDQDSSSKSNDSSKMDLLNTAKDAVVNMAKEMLGKAKGVLRVVQIAADKEAAALEDSVPQRASCWTCVEQAIQNSTKYCYFIHLVTAKASSMTTPSNSAEGGYVVSVSDRPTLLSLWNVTEESGVQESGPSFHQLTTTADSDGKQWNDVAERQEQQQEEEEEGKSNHGTTDERMMCYLDNSSSVKNLSSLTKNPFDERLSPVVDAKDEEEERKKKKKKKKKKKNYKKEDEEKEMRAQKVHIKMSRETDELGMAQLPNELALPGSSTSSKESVFIRLNNRLKTLEMNVSLSSQYLSELSRNYKRQIEEIQRLLNKTMQVAGDVEMRLMLLIKSQDQTLGVLQSKVDNLTKRISLPVDRWMDQETKWLQYHYWLFFAQLGVCLLTLVLLMRSLRGALLKREDVVGVVLEVLNMRAVQNANTGALQHLTAFNNNPYATSRNNSGNAVRLAASLVSHRKRSCSVNQHDKDLKVNRSNNNPLCVNSLARAKLAAHATPNAGNSTHHAHKYNGNNSSGGGGDRPSRYRHLAGVLFSADSSKVPRNADLVRWLEMPNRLCAVSNVGTTTLDDSQFSCRQIIIVGIFIVVKAKCTIL